MKPIEREPLPSEVEQDDNDLASTVWDETIRTHQDRETVRFFLGMKTKDTL